MILTLDLATVSGAAWDGPGGAAPLSASYRMPKPGGLDGAGRDYGAAFDGFETWLLRLIHKVRPATMVFEGPIPTNRTRKQGAPTINQDTIRLLYGVLTIAEKLGRQCGVPDVREIGVSTWKRQFAGNGHAKKPEVIARCRQLGWTPANDHEADAMGMWFFAKALTDPRWRPGQGPLFEGSAA